MDQASISFLDNQERNRAEYARIVEKRRATLAQVYLTGSKIATENVDIVCVANPLS